MSKKIRHHYVPVGLSKFFCLETKRLYLYDLHDGTIKPSSPKDVFLKKKLHSVTKDDGSIDHNFIEDEFMQIESKGLKAVKSIIEECQIHTELKSATAKLLSLQHLRTPVFRQGIESMLKNLLEATAKVLDAQGKLGEVPDILKPFGKNMPELFDNGAISTEITLPQVTMLGLCNLEAMHDILMKMNWCLLESKTEDFFVLSDHPFSILDPIFRKCGTGIGLAGMELELTMPIGARHCLLLSRKNIPSYLQANRLQVANINRRSAVFGKRLFVYPLKTKKILNFLKPYKAANFETEVQCIPSVNGSQLIPAINTIVGNVRLYEAIKPIF
ncbi:MAG: hypothetical protein COB36_14040 [Alphaproteobacteria bacterium]|nr:MAG: hypothetical protein COB36_14040 [Alphaproteobacteria bacterium]